MVARHNTKSRTATERMVKEKINKLLKESKSMDDYRVVLCMVEDYFNYSNSLHLMLKDCSSIYVNHSADVYFGDYTIGIDVEGKVAINLAVDSIEYIR